MVYGGEQHSFREFWGGLLSLAPKAVSCPDAALDAFQQGGHFRSRHDFLTLTKSFSI